MKSAAAPIRIHEEWVDDAACRPDATALPMYVWDDEVHWETDLQREVRHEIAKHVCKTHCPVREQCEDHAQRTKRKRMGSGIRGGRLFA